MAILSPITGAASSILSTVTSQAWGPLVSLCKNGTIAQLQNLKLGKLILFEGGSSKASAVFGNDKEGLPIAFLDVHDEKFWVRLALFADMVRSATTMLYCKDNFSFYMNADGVVGFRGKLHAGRVYFA